MEHKHTPLGMEGLGDLSWGTHFCLFYETEQDLLETLALYFEPGLANNEYCLWITPDSSDGKAVGALRQVIPSADLHLEKGSIEIVSGQEWYYQTDGLEATRVLQAFDTKLTQALEKGYARMRVLADEAWLDHERWKVFSEYERQIDERFSGKPTSILCAYPTVPLRAADILEVAQTHHLIVAKRNGNWEILESPEWKHAKAESERVDIERSAEQALQEARNGLEDKVQARIADLSQINKALQAEIIEYQQSEEALQRNEYRLQAAIDAANILLWERDLSAGHITWLGHHEKLLGFAPDELDDNTLASFEKRVHPEDIEELRRIRQRALEERSEYSHEYRVVWRDGSIHWIRAQGRFIYNEAGQPVRLYGAVLDITERKRLEEHLRKAELQYRTLVEHVPPIIYISGLGQHIGVTYISPRIYTLGFTPEEWLADPELWLRQIHPEDQQKVLDAITEGKKAGGVIKLEYRIRARHGSIHWFLDEAVDVTDENGDFVFRQGIMLDITERKRGEEALRKSEQVLREAESLGHTGSWEQNLITGEIFNTEENPRLFFGDDRTKGANFEDYAQVVHPDDREYVMRRRAELLEQEGPGDIEYRVVWPDGSVHVIFGRATVVRDGAGQPIRVYGTNVDITERKKAEAALRQSESNFRTLAEKSWQGIIIYQDVKIVYANIALSEITGYAIEELKSMSVEQLRARVHPLDLALVDEQTRKRMAGDPSLSSIEFRVFRKDGSMRWLQTFNNPIEYNGRPALLDLVIDITERKQAEEALRLSEQRFHLLTESIPILVWSARADGVSDYYNAPFLQYLGKTLEEMQGWVWVDTVHPDDRERSLALWTQAFSSGSDYEIEYRIQRAADGQYRWHLGRAVPLRDSSRKIVRWYGTCTDIHDRKQAEEEIKRQAARAETLARIAARLNKQLDLEAVIHAVCEEAVNTFKVSQATMSLYDKKRDLLLYAGGINIPPEYAAKMEPISRAQFDEFVRTMGSVVVVPDIQALPHVPNAEFSAQFDVRTVVTADMRRDQQLIGVLVLGVNGQVREFDKDELTLLKAMSDQAAQAIANARLFQTVSEHAARMEALVEISRTFAKAGLDYQSILNTVARRTAEIIGDACVITLFSDNAQRSFPVAFHHPDPKAFSMMQEALMHTWQGGTDTQRYQTLLAGDSIYIPFVNPQEFRASLEPEFWTFFEAIGISSVLIVPLKTDGHVIGTLGVTRDRQGNPYTPDDQVLLQNIADRATMSIQNARLFEQVQGAREQLEALSRRILEVQEVERRALTTELHDRVGQNLTGLSINLQNMKVLLSQEEAQKLASKFEDVQALVEDTTRQIRDIMAELYLPELEDYGLAAALETYAERAASRGNLELIADLPDLAPPLLPMDVRIAVFRAAQEAITNVLKHADATQLEISLQGENGKVRLRVEDNGQGFEPESASQKEAPSWGLQIMRGRMEAIGGHVQIESEPGQGTRVTFEIERPH